MKFNELDWMLAVQPMQAKGGGKKGSSDGGDGDGDPQVNPPPGKP